MNERERSPASRLVGTRLQRIDLPSDRLVCLQLGGRGLKGTLLVGLGPPLCDIGWSEQRPRGRAATAFVSRLRKHLGGARVAGLGARGPSAPQLELTRQDDRQMLVFEWQGQEGNLLWLDREGAVRAALHPQALRARGLREGDVYRAADPDAEPWRWPETLQELQARGQALVRSHREATVDAVRAPLARAVSRRLAQLKRRLSAIEADLERGDGAPQLRRQADGLLSRLHELNRHSTEVTYTDAEQGETVLSIDPALGPRGQAEAWYKKARKLERGAHIARERREQTEREIAALQQLRAEIDGLQTEQALQEARERAKQLGIRVDNGAGARSQSTPRRPFREFRALDGGTILVGRAAADNDALTLRHARPHDLWLHARDSGGSHVVVRLDKNQSCPPERLVDAALLAAHFSKLRNDSAVDVVYTPRRYVRKPKGFAPGLVSVDRAKVIRARAEPARLRQLLQREVRGPA